MENKKIIQIVIADGEYAEIYAPFLDNKEENDKKIKIGILTRLGMKKDEIDQVIDRLEVLPDKGGADGRFDDVPYTPVKLVKTIYKKPGTPSGFISEKEKKDKSKKKVKLEKKLSPKIRQTMLQQYYGDKEAEVERRKIFKRFKSHIIKKMIDTYDKDGTKRIIEVYTIEDYKEKTKDVDQLLLEGYQTRLERLSRAHQKDFSPYEREYNKLKISAVKEILFKYQEMHKLNAEEAEKFKKTAIEIVADFSSHEFKKDVIQALIDKDTEFIETNNYTYNSRQNTSENLKTLGKYGEKAVKVPISDEQKFIDKFGLNVINMIISIRNHTTQPVNKAIGTWVVSPIYRFLMGIKEPKLKEPINVDGYFITSMEDMLVTSQKRSNGMYTNKPTHRYHARKDYFIEEEKKALKNQTATISSLLKLAIIPRLRAIIEYKTGNKAILNAGLCDIENANKERNLQMNYKRHSIEDSLSKIASCDIEIKELKSLLKITKNSIEKEKIETVIKQRKLLRCKLEGKLLELERIEIDSVSTDAISMSQHDKANKANINNFKSAVKTLGGVYISKYLYKEVLSKAQTADAIKWIPSEEVEKEVTEIVTKTVEGMDKSDVGKITLEDVYDKSSGILSYDAYGGRTIADNTSFFRGLAFEFQGSLFSGSDGKGFDPTILTDVKLDQIIDKDTTIVSVVQEILQDKLSQQFSVEQINDLIISGEISGFKIWRSTSETEIPMGWLDASEIIPQIIKDSSHEVTETITKTITETIPGRWEIIPGEEYLELVKKLNPAVLATECGLAVTGINELLRYTRSAEDINIRHSDKLMEIAEKNRGDNKNTIIKGTSEQDVPKKEIRRTIKTFQRSNNNKKRYYNYNSKLMENFKGFSGTKYFDMKKSGYDENDIGINNKFGINTFEMLDDKEGEER